MTDKEYGAIIILRERAKVDFLSFMKWVWWMPGSFKVGRHTRVVCERLTRAVDDWMEGKSSNLMFDIPFRHGKSDMVSRAFPAFFLGRCAEKQPDVILTGYSASLSEGFSDDTKRIIQGEAYRELFPNVTLSLTNNSKDQWQIADSVGKVTVAGLGGSLTGKGGHLIVIDDYCRSAEEAYSKAYRDSTYNSVAVDALTRTNSPAAIVIICATRWHPDDVSGRLLELARNDSLATKWERITFPARSPGEYDYLFPEMYNAEWYDSQRARLGLQNAAALMDCNPIGDSLRWFKDEWIRYYMELPKVCNYYLLVDSANAKKKDSDFTTMMVVGFGPDDNYYLADCIHDRLNLTERTDAYFELCQVWRPICTYWEQHGAQSDVSHIESEMARKAWRGTIRAFDQAGIAKEDRIRWLQPIFEQKRMMLPARCIRRGSDGNLYDAIHYFLEDEYRMFPGCKHDDMLDCLANIKAKKIEGEMVFPRIIDRPGTGKGKNIAEGRKLFGD